MIDLLLKAIPDSDPNYAAKRIQLEEWYKPFGKKVLSCIELSSLAQKFNNFLDDKYWMYIEGDVLLSRAVVVKEILNLSMLDDEKNTLDDYNRYRAACWSCSELDIREAFKRLGESSTLEKEKFVAYMLGSDCKLMAFWSHYINIVDESGRYALGGDDGNFTDFSYVENSFKELMTKYDENLNYKNQNDLWKYGFECAKKEGCVEALEFFLEKLSKTMDQSEINSSLVATVLYASSTTHFSLTHSQANVIAFCIGNLRCEHYVSLFKENCEINGYCSILDRLGEKYLFGHAEKFINGLGYKNVTLEEYLISFICGVGEYISTAPNKKLREAGSKLLCQVWDNASVEHRNYCLEQMSVTVGNSELINMLLDLAQVGAFGPLEKILDSIDNGCKKIAKSFLGSYGTCCALYIQNRLDILDKAFGSLEHGREFSGVLNRLIAECPELQKDLEHAQELYRDNNMEKFKNFISEMVPHGGMYSSTMQVDSSTDCYTSSSLNDVDSTQLLKETKFK